MKKRVETAESVWDSCRRSMNGEVEVLARVQNAKLEAMGQRVVALSRDFSEMYGRKPEAVNGADIDTSPGSSSE